MIFLAIFFNTPGLPIAKRQSLLAIHILYTKWCRDLRAHGTAFFMQLSFFVIERNDNSVENM